MDKNFWVRVICSVMMFIIAMISMYAFDGQFFKVLVVFIVAMASIELFSFLTKKKDFINVVLIWYLIFGVCGYDIFAYLCGKLFGGKIFKKSRPFRGVSPNKTWEGTILGLAISMGLVALALYFTGSSDWAYLLCGPLALVGDLYESYLKRLFGVKDSNEIIVKNKFFEKIELVVGGSKGHGGFLDRVDSMAFAATVLFIIFAS